MKCHLMALGLLAAFPAAAANIDFAMERVQLYELAKLMILEVAGKSYSFDSEFLADEREVGFSLKNINKKQALGSFGELLQRNGYSFTLDGGIYTVRKHREESEEDQDVIYYRPKYRSVSYIREIMAMAFPKQFVNNKQAAQPGQPRKDAMPKQEGQGFEFAGMVKVPSVQQPNQQAGARSVGSQLPEVDALVFRGSAKQIKRINEMLVQVDRQAGQVLVRGHVYEVTTGAKEGSAFALALNLISKGSPGSAGVTNWAYRLGDVAKNLGNSVTLANSTIEGIFSAFATDSRFKVVSSPSLRVKSGTTATFSVGADVPVLGNVQMDKSGNPVQSVTYKPSGVILDIQAKIMEQEIELVIDQQLSSFVQTTTGVNNSPTLSKREIKTTIGASDGDVIILGGLDESRSSNDSTGLPYIPRFLRANGQEDTKTELILVMEVQKI